MMNSSVGDVASAMVSMVNFALKVILIMFSCWAGGNRTSVRCTLSYLRGQCGC